MSQNKAEDNDLLFKVQSKNRQKLYQQISKMRTNKDIEQYRQAVRQLYFNEGLFQSRKTRQLLQKVMQELNPSLHYTQQTQLMLKNIAKVFLIQLFQTSIQTRQKMPQKKDIDQEVLQQAFRKMNRH